MDKILENRIHKRQDGRWCLVYLPDAPDSKRRYIYGKTKKEVIGKVEKLEEAADSAASSREDTEKIIFKYRKRRVKQQDQQAESAITPDSDVSEKKSQWTLQAWIMFYLENYKRNELKQTTYDSYMGIWRSHILNSKLGKSKLENVNGETLQQFYNEMSNNGYNAKTVRHAVERQYTFHGGICGQVKLVVMKVHASLQAVRLCMTRYRLRGRT